MLGRKLGRDLFRLRGQVLTIALVLACGIMAMIMLRGTLSSLLESRDQYYAEERFADVFARLERAPATLVPRLERIPGVARVYARVVEDVMVAMADTPDPITGRIVSMPEAEPPPLNGVVLRAGRLPATGADDEILILEKFAEAHGLVPGDALPAVVNGSLRQLRIVGIAISPEYIFAMAGHEMIADERLFVVIWMAHDAVAAMFRMEGAFNDLAIDLQPGAVREQVLAELDRELEPYGGFHAVGRDKQMSNYVLANEIEQLRGLANVIPMIFLAVAAFLVQVVISRLVYLERTQIAVLKAVGYGDWRIGLHYLGLVALIVLIGGALGIALGLWAGRWMSNLYTQFFQFPGRVHKVSPELIVGTMSLALVAAASGALGAVRRVARMQPAQAMLPPAPLAYRRSLLERLGLGRVLGPSSKMVTRELSRRPLRFLLSSAGIAMAVAIFIMGRFSWDSFDWLMHDVFLREHRENLVVNFLGPRPAGALRELEHLPGVQLAEGQRVIAARFRVGSHWRDTVIYGIEPGSQLRQLLHAQRTVLTLPPEGVIVTDQLAKVLGVGVGDTVTAELFEGDFPTRTIVIAGLIDEPFGLQAYARIDWLGRLMREEPRVNAALLRIEGGRGAEVRDRLKQLPAVIGVASVESIIESYEGQTGESILIITIIMTLSAAAIAVGVVYNNARIALSMRSRDLASLRVLGFTRREISAMLLGELALQLVVGIPLGLWAGTQWAKAYVASFNPEAMRFPLAISDTTYGAAAVIVIVAGLLSALLVRHKLDHLDLVAVLKAE